MRITLALTGLLLFVCAPALFAQDARVVVASELRSDGAITYHYRVFNDRTGAAVVAVQIGADRFSGATELTGRPVGWNARTATPYDIGFAIPAESSTSPTGFRVALIRMEESALSKIEWRAVDPTASVPAGARRRGFSVTLPQPDNAYKNGHWTAIFDDGVSASALLENDPNPAQPDDDQQPLPDVTPPHLTLTIDPMMIWPPNNKMVRVTTHVTVTDDRDAHPTVHLVSVGCSDGCDTTKDVSGASIGTLDTEFLVRASRNGDARSGRVYTFVYRATDAAGNSVNATVSTKVPHDRRDNSPFPR